MRLATCAHLCSARGVAFRSFTSAMSKVQPPVALDAVKPQAAQPAQKAAAKATQASTGAPSKDAQQQPVSAQEQAELLQQLLAKKQQEEQAAAAEQSRKHKPLDLVIELPNGKNVRLNVSADTGSPRGRGV